MPRPPPRPSPRTGDTRPGRCDGPPPRPSPEGGEGERFRPRHRCAHAAPFLADSPDPVSDCRVLRMFRGNRPRAWRRILRCSWVHTAFRGPGAESLRPAPSLGSIPSVRRRGGPCCERNRASRALDSCVAHSSAVTSSGPIPARPTSEAVGPMAISPRWQRRAGVERARICDGREEFRDKFWISQDYIYDG